MDTWRLLRTGAGDPAWNMAVDEAVVSAVSRGRAAPTVRFYGWNPPTLSIGYFQRAEAEVELDRLAEAGVGFVRRPTGGRAVLHDRELTYSIAVPENYPGIPKTVTEAYRVLSEGLRQGFIRLGLQAEMAKLADGNKEAFDAPGSAACFDSPSWYELLVEGRKVAGSAQLRHNGAVLQHGSVLLDLDAGQLFRLLKFRSAELREKLSRSFGDKAVAINPLLAAIGRPPVSFRDAEEAFRLGMEEGLGVRLAEEELTDEERETAERLVREKYGNNEWNLRR